MTAIAKTTTDTPAALLEKVVVGGDLGKLSPAERMNYYRSVCESVGLNPLTRPFDYLVLQGKTTLYARKDATDQLRSLKQVSVQITGRERVEDVYVVTARATTSDGRTDESTGAVTIGSLKGDALANALMKAETKAKRRVTLSICGLGWLDETEIETIPGAATVAADADTGEVDEARQELLQRCRDAAVTLGKDRLKVVRKGRKPDGMPTDELEAFAVELEAAVKALQAEEYEAQTDADMREQPGDTFDEIRDRQEHCYRDYVPGEEG